jgi:gliding motility-associated-like protein
MYMPNAFSPNEDGINDFFPDNHYSDPGGDYALTIVNQWGEKLFFSNKPELKWDGTYRGHLAPAGIYLFFVKYTGCDGAARSFRGTLTLLR